MDGENNFPLWPLIVIPVLTLVVYANSLHGAFVFDDQAIIFQDPKTMNTRSFSDVLATGRDYRELLFVTYRLNYYLGGLETFGYHLVNIIAHAVNSLLVYGIILIADRRKQFQPFTAIAAAAVFCVHPIFTGAVSYIGGRSSLLCATFYFSAILLFLKAIESSSVARRVLLLMLTVVAGFLAWETKQESVTLPLFLAAILVLRSKRRWYWAIPPVAITIGLAFIILVRPVSPKDQSETLSSILSANRSLVAAGSEKVLPSLTYFRTSIGAVVHYYFPRFIVPLDLSIDPDVPTIDHWYDWRFLSAIFVLVFFAYLSLHFSQREPLLSLGFAGIIVSPLLARTAIPLADIVLEHRAYIPGLGIAFLSAWLFQRVARDYDRLRWRLLSGVLIVFALMTVNRNTAWSNSLTLWEDAAAKAPMKLRPHVNLGQAYQEAGRVPEAIREYENALALKPDTSAALSNLAGIYLDRGDYGKSEEMLLKVTSTAPDFADGFINLGALYIRKKEADKALAALNRALEINSQNAAAHFDKGEALAQKNDFKTALESYKQAVRLRPDMPSFRLTLAETYLKTQDRASAEKEFLELVNGPAGPDVLRNLGIIYRDAGEPDKAIQYFEQAARLRFIFPDLHNDLGILYLQKKMLNLAIEQFKTTLQQQPDYGPAILNLALAQMMNGESSAAKQILQDYLQQYGNVSSPYTEQVRQRLEQMK